MDQEALSSVKALSTVPDLASIALAAVPSIVGAVIGLAGVLWGARAHYRAVRNAERERFDEETQHLAKSIAAEVRAGQAMLDRMEQLMKGRDQAFLLESLRYTDMSESPLPITLGAAEKVGRFTPRVAIGIATLLVQISNLRQSAMTIRAMHNAGVLSDDKLMDRLQITSVLAIDVKDAGRDLARAIDDDYGMAT